MKISRESGQWLKGREDFSPNFDPNKDVFHFKINTVQLR